MSPEERRGVAAMWALGDYAAVAARLEPAAAELARRVGDGHGRRALDVATGTGSVALALARSGWAVSACDLSAPLLTGGQRVADEHDLVIDWREAALDELPFHDAAFSVVTSSFGLIFAPDPVRAVVEAARCLASGGTLAFTAWTADGYMAEMAAQMARFLPTASDRRVDPMAWGEPQVLALLADGFGDVTTTRHLLPWLFDDAQNAVEFYFTHSPAHVAAARAAGGDAGQMREAVRSHLAGLASPSGRVEIEAAYTLTSARRV